MQIETSFISQFFVGNLTYVLLITSMIMTQMFWLRVFAIAAGLVGAIYAWFWLGDPISTTWELIFVGVNIVQIALASYRNAVMTFTPEERVFYSLVVPSLEPHQVRNLLRIGQWHRAEPGQPLLQQGLAASHLIFIKSGDVDILHDGKVVGKSGSGTLIGEISVATGEPATASAVVGEAAHYFAIEKESLRKLKKADPKIAHAIEACSRENLKNKLVQMNIAVAGDELTEIRGSQVS